MPFSLRYLHFDLSTGHEDDRWSLDAMASVSAPQWPALQEEVCRVLGWLHATHPHTQGPAEEGGLWDVALHASQERSQSIDLHFDPASGRLHGQAQPGDVWRHSLSLTLSLEPGLAQAVCEAFGLTNDAV